MNTNRIVLADLDEIKESIDYEEHNILFGEDIVTIKFGAKNKKIIPYKRKVILIKFPEESYVELVKIKGLKDLIKIYYEIIFYNPKNSQYLLKTYNYQTNKQFIKEDSITAYEGDLKKHESIKSLRKKLLK